MRLKQRPWLAIVLALVAGASRLPFGAPHGAQARMQRPETEASVGAPSFVAASAQLRSECLATARAVGYPVPCPTRVPPGLVANGGRPGCELAIIGPGRHCPDTAASWKGWVVGSSVTVSRGLAVTAHLVITASPHRLTSDAKLVNGPAWYPAARVRVLGHTIVNGWRTTEVLVPFATNDGSAFAGHVVLIWTVGDHTYGIGFHDLHGVEQTLHLDLALARGIVLVRS